MQKPLSIYFGHHKAASGWFNGILRETCFKAGWKFAEFNTDRDFSKYGSLRAAIDVIAPDVISYRNADINQLNDMPPYRGFHVIRDPRDIVVSAYFSHLSSHATENWPELVKHRQKLNAIGKDLGIISEIDFSRQFINLISNWDYDNPNILELTLEDISSDPVNTLIQAMRFIHILPENDVVSYPPLRFRAIARLLNQLHYRGRRRLPKGLRLYPYRHPFEFLYTSELISIIEKNNFQRLAGGRSRGTEDTSSHYRKGIAGDWRNHFTADHVKSFKHTYPLLCTKLGYTKDESWLNNPD